MSTMFTYPGVYLTETSDTPRSIAPATTSLTAIIGIFPRGPIDEAVLVTSLSEFEANFGGDAIEGLATYAVRQFFVNGGTGAWIVRLNAPSVVAATATTGGIKFTANSPGSWGNAIGVQLTPSKLPGQSALVDLSVTMGSGSSAPVVEQIPSLPSTVADRVAMINAVSAYVTATAAPHATANVASPEPASTSDGSSSTEVGNAGSAPANAPAAPANAPIRLANGSDGTWTEGAFTDAVNEQLGVPPATTTADPLLSKIAPQVFNLLCIPDLVWLGAGQLPAVQNAHAYAAERQAFLLVDPPPPAQAKGPAWMDPKIDRIDSVGVSSAALEKLAATWGGNILVPKYYCGAVYYPWLIIPDPLDSGSQLCVPPSGSVAGIYAATDATRGVWKAPAGVDASLAGVVGLADKTIDDTANGSLNVLGINAIRALPSYGIVVWGSRTLAGSNLNTDLTWRYVPVRRLTDFIEQTLVQSLRWAIFEPNGPALWASISLEVGAFMSGLYAAGAFSGATAAKAYTVACDSTTTSTADMLAGIVRVSVGFQPVEPAEFVALNIVLNAGTAAN
jgi:phage tail sheath protein FI